MKNRLAKTLLATATVAALAAPMAARTTAGRRLVRTASENPEPENNKPLISQGLALKLGARRGLEPLNFL